MLAEAFSAYIRRVNHRGQLRVLRKTAPFFNGRAIRTRYGPIMRLWSADYTSFTAVTGRGPWIADYDDVYEEVSNLRQGMAFIDIGANAGLFTLVASPKVGASGLVLAFEPSPRTFAKLVDNINLNGLKNVIPFNAALATASQQVHFSFSGNDHTGASHLSRDGADVVAQFRFSDISTALDGLIGQRSVMIKIDVEGAEKMVLDGFGTYLRDPRVKTIIIEIDPENLARFGADDRAIYSLLNEAGFHPRRGLNAAKHYNEIFSR